MTTWYMFVSDWIINVCFHGAESCQYSTRYPITQLVGGLVNASFRTITESFVLGDEVNSAAGEPFIGRQAGSNACIPNFVPSVWHVMGRSLLVFIAILL